MDYYMNGKIFCGNRLCQKDCARNDSHIEYGALYLREIYKPDKKGNCQYFEALPDKK